MSDIVPFPEHRTRRQQEQQRDEQLRDDPYYQLIKHVMVVVEDCGFQLPNSVESCAQRWFDRNAHCSPLALSLRNSELRKS